MPYLRRSRTKRASLGLKRKTSVLLFALLAAVFIPSAASDTYSPPTITLSATGTKGDNGWYRSTVTASWTVSDPTGISSSSGCTTTVLSNETAGTTLSCTATNNADPPLTSSVSVTFKIDKTPPTVVDDNPQRPPDANGWYNHPVSFSFTGSDALSGIVSCPSTTYGGPDNAAAAVTTICRDKAGNTASRSFGLSYDATGPTVSGGADRPPDHDAWYNHAVTIRFGGTDGVSGIDSCTSTTYAGPESESAAVAGSCRDRAGNTGSASLALKYDSTSPTLTGVSVKSGVRADVLRWKSSSPTDTVQIRRAPRGRRAEAQQTVFRGGGPSFTDTGIQDGLEYVYSVQTYDQAGNASKTISRLALPKVLTLRKTPYVPRAAADPILRWPDVRSATYYHVQLFRGSTRILAAWPSRPELGLRASWRWAGHVYRLAPGRYRWYAWAGLGRRSAAHYRLLGKAEFIVPST